MTIPAVLPTIGELIGALLASYGLLRQSFADLAEQRAYGEGRFGEGTYGGGPGRVTRIIVAVGVRARLLPGDRKLTLTDRKHNAALAIAGVALVVISMITEIWATILPLR